MNLIGENKTIEVIMILNKISNDMKISKDKKVLFSLMSQFTPTNGGNLFPELNRSITNEEFDAVKLWLFSSGIEFGFIQEMESANADYIPDFDLTGI